MKTVFGTTPVIGYRVWEKAPQGILHSPMMRMIPGIWSTKAWVTAECLDPCPEASTIPCDDVIYIRAGNPVCGLHCCKSLATLKRTCGFLNKSAYFRPLVVGTVELAGIVYEGERGYRGEYARIRKILGPWHEVFPPTEKEPA